MANPGFTFSTHYRRLSLAEIDAVVSAHMGPTRVPGNAQPACFNRQVAMYFAKYLAGWSTATIGQFYNGRDHSTVIHGIQRVEALRESDPEVDTLLSELKDQLTRKHDSDEEKDVRLPDKHQSVAGIDVDELAEAVAERVWARMADCLRKREATASFEACILPDQRSRRE